MAKVFPRGFPYLGWWEPYYTFPTSHIISQEGGTILSHVQRYGWEKEMSFFLCQVIISPVPHPLPNKHRVDMLQNRQIPKGETYPVSSVPRPRSLILVNILLYAYFNGCLWRHQFCSGFMVAESGILAMRLQASVIIRHLKNAYIACPRTYVNV